MKSVDNASISAMCSPSGYSIYLFTIVLYRGSVKHLLPEMPGNARNVPEKSGQMDRDRSARESYKKVFNTCNTPFSQ